MKEDLKNKNEPTNEVNAQIKWERDMLYRQLKANDLIPFCKNHYGWIPCSERQPKEKNRYLVTRKVFEKTFIDIAEYDGDS